MAVNASQSPLSDDPYISTTHSLPGETLKQTRLAQSKTLADVTKGTNLPEKNLLALEADRYETLPEPTYVKGYIRAYAKFLGLPSDDLVRRYEETIGVVAGALPTLNLSQKNEGKLVSSQVHGSTPVIQELEALATQEKKSSGAKFILKLLMFALFFATMVFVALQLPLQQWMNNLSGVPSVKSAVPNPTVPPVATNPPDVTTAPTTVAATPVPLTEATSSTVTPTTATSTTTDPTTVASTVASTVAVQPATPNTSVVTAQSTDLLRFDLTKDTELTVFDEAGNTLISGKQVMGKPIELHGKAPFQVTIPDASGVQMHLNNAVVDLAPHLKNGALDLRLAP